MLQQILHIFGFQLDFYGCELTIILVYDIGIRTVGVCFSGFYVFLEISHQEVAVRTREALVLGQIGDGLVHRCLVCGIGFGAILQVYAHVLHGDVDRDDEFFHIVHRLHFVHQFKIVGNEALLCNDIVCILTLDSNQLFLCVGKAALVVDVHIRAVVQL